MPSLDYLKIFAEAHGVELRTLPIQKRRKQEKYALYKDGKYTPRFNSLIAARDQIDYRYKWNITNYTAWQVVPREDYLVNLRNRAVKDYAQYWQDHPTRFNTYITRETKREWLAEVILLLPTTRSQQLLLAWSDWLNKNAKGFFQYHETLSGLPEIDFQSARDAASFKITWANREEA
jgi:hypothetical protein